MKTIRASMIFSLLIAICLLGQVNLAQAVVLDDFNDGKQAPIWFGVKQGTGLMYKEINHRLEITLFSTATGATPFLAGYQSKFQMGLQDFEIIVDFRLLTWPVKNGVAVGINTPLFSLTRISYANGEYIIFSSADHTFNQIFPTTASSGKLRIKRVDNSIIGSFWTLATGWHNFPPYSPDPIPKLPIYLGGGSLDAIFGNQKVIAALDNFVVNKGTLLWP